MTAAARLNTRRVDPQYRIMRAYRDSIAMCFSARVADPEKLAQFAGAMSGLSTATGQALADKFPWRDYSSVIDVGCAQGAVQLRLQVRMSI
jgi:hypothetical protein